MDKNLNLRFVLEAMLRPSNLWYDLVPDKLALIKNFYRMSDVLTLNPSFLQWDLFLNMLALVFFQLMGFQAKYGPRLHAIHSDLRCKVLVLNDLS